MAGIIRLEKDGTRTTLADRHEGRRFNGPNDLVVKSKRYDVLGDDTLANGRLFVAHGVDGMKTDERGNLYTTSGGTPGMVQVTAAEGRPLGRFNLPQPSYEPRPRVCATNVAFGDADSRTLYITACTHVFSIRLKVAGSRGPAM